MVDRSGKPSLVIKTLLGDKAPAQMAKSVTNTLESYAHLKLRENSKGDIKLAKFYNEKYILEQGFSSFTNTLTLQLQHFNK